MFSGKTIRKFGFVGTEENSGYVNLENILAKMKECREELDDDDFRKEIISRIVLSALDDNGEVKDIPGDDINHMKVFCDQVKEERVNE